MNKMKLISLLLLFLIGTASAALYVTTNYMAHLYFERNMPGPEPMSVQTLIECGDGYTNKCYMGAMGDNNTLYKKAMHTNMEESTVTGIVLMELECDEVFTLNIDEIEYVNITYPFDVNINCTDGSCITRVSDTKILIKMTDVPRNFYAGSSVYSDIKIGFDPMAYGSYVLTVYVE